MICDGALNVTNVHSLIEGQGADPRLVAQIESQEGCVRVHRNINVKHSKIERVQPSTKCRNKVVSEYIEILM